jgi:hypothetical protein
MEKTKNFGDRRQTGFCFQCGGNTGTVDHLPSKILLDDPLPQGWKPLPCCEKCNNGLSNDEEYLAIFVECVVSGSTDPEKVARPKIRSALLAHSSLRAKIEKARQETLRDDGSKLLEWSLDTERAKRVLLKLARGHAAYELNEPMLDAPHQFWFCPIHSMTNIQRTAFESAPETNVFPEVGSRAMQRMMQGQNGWITVQPGRYRYLATASGEVVVRAVLSEYLAFEAVWS